MDQAIAARRFHKKTPPIKGELNHVRLCIPVMDRTRVGIGILLCVEDDYHGNSTALRTVKLSSEDVFVQVVT